MHAAHPPFPLATPARILRARLAILVPVALTILCPTLVALGAPYVGSFVGAASVAALAVALVAWWMPTSLAVEGDRLVMRRAAWPASRWTRDRIDHALIADALVIGPGRGGRVRRMLLVDRAGRLRGGATVQGAPDPEPFLAWLGLPVHRLTQPVSSDDLHLMLPFSTSKVERLGAGSPVGATILVMLMTVATSIGMTIELWLGR